MKLALSGGGIAQVDMEKASWRQPGGPENFPSPHRQHAASDCPKNIDDLGSVAHGTDRVQGVLPRRSGSAVVVARLRLAQFTALMRFRNGGPCTTDDASLLVDEAVALLAVACSPRGFRFAVEEWSRLNTPRLASGEIDDAVARTLPNPPCCTSAACGTRWKVSVDEYDGLGLAHIWPAGWSRRKLDLHLKKRRALKVTAMRQASGFTKTPRRLSVEQLKPWKRPDAPCSSRAGFYRLSELERGALVALARAETQG